MIIRKSQQNQHTFELFGAKFTVLLPRENAECSEILLEEWPEGFDAPLNHHEEMEQVYYIVEGQGNVVVGEEEGEVSSGDIVFIPRMAQHCIRNIGKGNLSYLCFDMFPEGYPKGEETWSGHEKIIFKQFGSQSIR